MYHIWDLNCFNQLHTFDPQLKSPLPTMYSKGMYKEEIFKSRSPCIGLQGDSGTTTLSRVGVKRWLQGKTRQCDITASNSKVEGQRGPGSRPGTAPGLSGRGSVSFWVFSTFNFSTAFMNRSKSGSHRLLHVKD